MKHLNHTMIEAPLQVIPFKLLAPAGSPRTGLPGPCPPGFCICPREGISTGSQGCLCQAWAESCSVSPISACTCLAHQFGFSRLPAHPVNKTKKPINLSINMFFLISVAIEYLTGVSRGKVGLLKLLSFDMWAQGGKVSIEESSLI